MSGTALRRSTSPRKLGVLRRHCDAVGRDYDAIVRSHTINPLVLANRPFIGLEVST